MGKYLNPGNLGFQSALNSQIYVDKTGFIEQINQVLGTMQRYVCVSRARRFGKTMAEQMLAAYYDRSCDSKEQFRGLAIEKAPSFEQHLNKYEVVFIDMQGMRERTLNAVRHGEDTSVVRYLQKEVIAELKEEFPEAVRHTSWQEVMKALEGYEGEILLVGINYDKESKKHHCKIEKVRNGS